MKDNSAGLTTPRQPLLPSATTADLLGPPLLSFKEICAWAGVSGSTMYGLMQAGRGPRGTKLGRKQCFLPADVLAWYNDRAADRAAELESRSIGSAT